MLLVGIDLVECKRIEKSLKNEHFCRRVYGLDEQKWLKERKFCAESAAACFCAKEAFGKAMGIGICGFALSDVQLMHRASGCPYLKLSGRAADIAKGIQFSVSVTHTREYASVVVIGEPEKE